MRGHTWSAVPAARPVGRAQGSTPDGHAGPGGETTSVSAALPPPGCERRTPSPASREAKEHGEAAVQRHRLVVTDLIGLAGRLYIATETVTASGAGTASIPIAPPLREALLINQPLVLTKPTVAMRLVSDDEAANPTRPGRFTAITIRLEEAL